MSFTGTLDDFSPVEIITVLDLLRKSGKLRLNRGDDEGLVVFRRGKIIYAASSGFRENLGTMLLARRLVDEGQLVEALGLQVACSEEKRLGTILIEMGALSQDDLNDVILEQVIQTVAEFGHWESGEFDFSSLQIKEHGEVELQSGELWAPLGLSPNHVLLRLAQAMDESARDQAEVAVEALPQPVPEVDEDAPEIDLQAETLAEPSVQSEPKPIVPVETEGLDPELPTPDTSASLNDLVGEVRGPQVKGELIHKLLEQAGQVFGRCLIFSVRQDGFRSIAQTGQLLPEPTNGSKLLEVVLGRNEPNLLSQCTSSGHTVRATLPRDTGEERLIDALGGAVEEKSVAMPLAVRGETVLILYGDSQLQDLPTGWAENLEGFLSESGQQIEADIQAEIAAEIAAASAV